MRFQLLGCRERRRARPDRAQAIGGEFLHGDLLLVTGHRHAAVAARVTVGRQYVIAAAAVIAHRFGRPLAEENRAGAVDAVEQRSEEHTSELQSLMRNSYAVFCLKKK